VDCGPCPYDSHFLECSNTCIDGGSKHGTWSHQAVMPSQPSPSTKPSDSESTLQNRSAKIGLICHYSKIVWVSLTHFLDPIIPPPW
jgi:hypothetical protein